MKREICIFSTLFPCLFFIGFVQSSESDYDGPMSITLYHALNVDSEPHWESRGHMTVQNVASGYVTSHQSPLDVESSRRLKVLSDKDSFYRLKAVVKTSQGREVNFLTFVKACALVESQLKDYLTVSVDHEGSVVGVSQSTALTSCASANTEKLPSSFLTTVEFKPIEQGPVPDTASYIQKLEREREARERGETKDNRSFLAKYWMYIVPIVLFVVLSGASNPEGAGPAR
ncbi:ER membrane protein complex subunit 10 [Nilaparvata lugens]|uniref:ER membrane protein complex subunit 10 n=1 Tax=Nilaparvata lugens TaxID=108931 RepID=UPI00193D7376|nr:ER membrane protein complex subunit 10 [Nilaparvata lugens]